MVNMLTKLAVPTLAAMGAQNKGGLGSLGADKLQPAAIGAQGAGKSSPLGASNVNPAMMGVQGGGLTSPLGASGANLGTMGAQGGGLTSPLGSSPATTGAQGSTQASTLGSYNVDSSSVSISGLSAGGFMAAQLGIAYSDVFKAGFGIFAGGPFDCARDQSV